MACRPRTRPDYSSPGRNGCAHPAWNVRSRWATSKILEAWIWPQHGRVLLGWYERFRDASAALDADDPDAQAARNQAKVIRTHGIGHRLQ